jgi:membrane fusion protein (multidrug efflux system)
MFRNLIAILLSFAVTLAQAAGETSIAKKVDVIQVNPKAFNKSVSLIGTVNAKYQTTLKAKTVGNLEFIVEAGVTVKSGEELVRIQNSQAIKTYNLAKSAVDVAKSKYDRAATLSEKGLISKNELNTAQQQYIEAQKQVQQAETEYNNNIMTAPFEGIVGVAKFRPGAQVNQGDELLVLYKPDEIVIDLNIPEKIVKKVSIGQKVFISGGEYKISSVQKFIDQSTRMAPATIKYPCPECVIGSSVDVSVVLYESADAFVIPDSAIFSRDKENKVFIVKNGKAVLSNVKIKNSDEGYSEIVDGVKASDLIVIRGMQKLHDGDKVETQIVK